MDPVSVTIVQDVKYTNFPSILKDKLENEYKVSIEAISSEPQNTNILIIPHLFELDKDYDTKSLEIFTKYKDKDINLFIFIARLIYIPSRNHLYDVEMTRINKIIKLMKSDEDHNIRLLMLPVDVYGPEFKIPRSFVMSKLCKEVLLSDAMNIYSNDHTTIRPLYLSDLIYALHKCMLEKKTGITEIMPRLKTELEINKIILKIRQSSKNTNLLESNYGRAQQTIGQIKIKEELPVQYVSEKFGLEEGLKCYLNHIEKEL